MGEKHTDKKATLTVLTEQAFESTVQMRASAMEDENENLDIQVEVLPLDMTIRENEIQKLQIEIMAGKGPDLYVLTAPMEMSTVEPDLFDNPYQIIQSGAFAPLDSYMDEDSYWKEGSYKKEFLEVGKHDGKQYLLPFTCSYYVLEGIQDINILEGKSLGEWLEYAKQSENLPLRQCILEGLSQFGGRWFQSAVDYETGQVRFDKEKWKQFGDTEEIPGARTIYRKADVPNQPYERSGFEQRGNPFSSDAGSGWAKNGGGVRLWCGWYVK